jgi:hypothetical protein
MNSPQDAINSLNTLPKKLNLFTSEDEKKLATATSYFEANHAYFKDDEIKEMFKYKAFSNNLDRNVAKDILKQCVVNKQIYPVVIDKWMKDNSDSVGRLFFAYIRIAYINDADEQLSYIHKKDSSYLNAFARDLKNPSIHLQNLILEGDPKKIWQLEDISDNVAIAHFEKHKAQIIEMTLDYEIHESVVVQNKIYDLISEHFITNGVNFNTILEQTPFVNLINNYGEDLLKVFNNKNPDFLSNVLKNEVTETVHPYRATLNFAQFLCFNSMKNSPNSETNEQKYIIKHYFDILLHPVKETVCDYAFSVDVFEFSLRNKHLGYIIGFTNAYDNLSNQSKNIYTTAVFQCLNNCHVLENATYLAQQKLEPVSKELIEIYFNKNLSFLSEEKKEVIQKILFHKKLDDNLDESPHKGLKIKI